MLKKKVKLLTPNIKYYETFKEAVIEHANIAAKESDLLAPFETVSSKENFQHYLNEMISFKTAEPPNSRLIYWAVKDKEYIGRVLIRPLKNDFYSLTSGSIGYSVKPSARNKGFGTLLLYESVKICESLNLTPSLLIHENNVASLKVAENNGFKFQRKESVYKYFVL